MVNLLFDYDGTLHDSLAIYAPAVQEAYDTLVTKGLAQPKTWERETIRQWIGLSPQAMWDQFQPNLSQTEKQAGSAQIGRRMQELVEEKAERYIRMFGLCDCPRCVADVKALALTSLPAKYVVLQETARRPMVSLYRARYDAPVTAQLLSACKQVMDAPRHGASPQKAE